jgi:23S rRNA G2445 N2-methylase RlmL
MVKYYALVVSGLEKVAWKDIRARLEDVELIGQEPGKLLFSYSGDPRNLLYLRPVENVYVFVRNITGITRSRKSLGDIFKRVRSTDLETASRLHKQAHRSKGKKKLTFKVVTSKLGRHNFRRVDVQQAVETAIKDKYGWQISRQDPILEMRIDLEEDSALLGLKLSDEIMRLRAYKVSHLPASLKPTVAYCMALLSNPSARDVFVDPMCGVGTIPIERAFAGPYRKIIASDVEESIVRAARDNADASRKAVLLATWDISAMPLQDGVVDKIVCNLPFGKRVGSHSENQILYSKFFREMVRVSKSGGRAVLLTSERELMSELIRRHSSVYMERYLRIDLLGIRAHIYVLNLR